MHILALYGVTLLVFLLGSVMAWQERTNVLGKHEGWIATKTTHEVDLMGAPSLLQGPQALSGNRLNLHAWHGFQEVWRNVDTYGADELSFDVHLLDGAYLCFWWKTSDASRSAVLMSNRRDRSGGFMLLNGEGRFLERSLRSELNEVGSGWHQVKVDWRNGLLELGEQVFQLPGTHLSPPKAIGFRGGREGVSVDSISLSADGVSVYAETFFNRADILATGMIAFAGALGVLLLFEVGIRWLRPSYPVSARVSLCISFMMITGGVFGYVRFIESRSYPSLAGRIAYLDETFRERLKVAFREEFAEKYGQPAGRGNELRILFMGGSQTWGAGASTMRHCFEERIQHQLSKDFDKPIVCMNGGVRSARVEWMADVYSDWLKDYHPDLFILNVSSNDSDLDVFRTNVERLKWMCNENNVRLVFVCEPESPEVPSDLDWFHQILRELSSKGERTHVVEAHAYLKDHEDTGLLWWDHVHPTDYGHYLLAECLFKAIVPIIHSE